MFSKEYLEEGIKEKYLKLGLDTIKRQLSKLKRNKAKCLTDKCRTLYQKRIDKIEKIYEKHGGKEKIVVGIKKGKTTTKEYKE